MSVFTNPASGSREQAKEYVSAVLGLLEGREPLDVLERTSDALNRLSEGLSSSQLNEPEEPGKWSLNQVLQHLADSELVWGYRLRMVLAHDRPTLTGYDQDLWATRLGYSNAEPTEALDRFAVLRAATLKLLRRLSAADLQRVGLHSERGEETVAHMLGLYAGHDLLHLRQMERVREKVVG